MILSKSMRVLGGTVLFVIFVAVASWAAAPAGAPVSTPVKVVVLPFNMHTPPQLAYLQDGIRDMLTSRLAWQGKVQVLDRTATNQALQSKKSDITLDEALRIGKILKADYVLFGSVTALGQSISIDAKMAATSGSAEPLSLYGQSK